MTLSRPFIERPIATSLLMVALLLVGMVAYRQLPISALPQVDYPTIQILTFYPGRVAGRGRFDDHGAAGAAIRPVAGLEPDDLQQLLRQLGHHAAVQPERKHRRGRAGGAGVDQRGGDVSAQGPAQSADLQQGQSGGRAHPDAGDDLATMPLPQVEDLADTTFAQKISQLPGVGLVSISGGQKPAMRIQANPVALASYGMSLETLRNVIAQVNVDQAKGQIDGPRQSYTIGANDQLMSSQDYAERDHRLQERQSGAAHRCRDVIEGAENSNQAAWMNTTPAVIVNIQRQPGANIIKVVDSIKQLLPQLQSSPARFGQGERPHRPHRDHSRHRSTMCSSS